MTGNRQAHPVLISCADIDMDFRMKASHHTFLLLAIFPIPKFTEKNPEVRGMLVARLYHECMDIVLEPLKIAARIGIMMDDALGARRYCFTPLAAFIVDTPESNVISCVKQKTSSVTLASYKQLGDEFKHETRTAEHTLALIAKLVATVDPMNLDEFEKAAKLLGLNGVLSPFWRDWVLAQPPNFLTPEVLHHWHKLFGDHDLKWCIALVGAAEIDFRFSLLRPHTGMRHFKEGISKGKQVTCREYRDIQRYILPVIAGAVSQKAMVAIRSLLDFRYYGQAPIMTEDDFTKLEGCLQSFHDNKDAIMQGGGRVGKKKRPLNNWYIPKLEFMQSVVSNIRLNGPCIQWSADVTEHAHITELKDPADHGNNRNFEQQICRHLDRADKCRMFDLATSIRDADVDFGQSPIQDENGDNEDEDDGIDFLQDTAELLQRITPASHLAGPKRAIANYFSRALQLPQVPNARVPYRTFVSGDTGFQLNRDPSSKQVTLAEVMEKFHLPDLEGAVRHYIHRVASGIKDARIFIGGRRQAVSDKPFPFLKLQYWSTLRIQRKSYHLCDQILLPQTVNASPPDASWPFGRGDAVIVNTNSDYQWPKSGLRGK